MAGACAAAATELSAAAAAVSAASSVTKRGKPRRASWDTELQRARRATVARSWCAGYGALAEEEEDVAEPVRRCASRDLVMPSLKNLVSMATLSRRRSSSTTALNSQREVPRMPAAKSVAALPLLRETALTLSSVQVRPVNRLRLGSSKMCSRCSSILSMASSSRYSINTAGFVQLSQPDCRSVLCKLCLLEVPPHLTWTLQHCACTFCIEVSLTHLLYCHHSCNTCTTDTSSCLATSTGVLLNVQ